MLLPFLLADFFPEVPAVYEIPVPRMPSVVFTPLLLIFVVQPLLPIDVLTPLLLIFIASPGAIRIRLRNLNPIGNSFN